MVRRALVGRHTRLESRDEPFEKRLMATKSRSTTPSRRLTWPGTKILSTRPWRRSWWPRTVSQSHLHDRPDGHEKPLDRVIDIHDSYEQAIKIPDENSAMMAPKAIEFLRDHGPFGSDAFRFFRLEDVIAMLSNPSPPFIILYLKNNTHRLLIPPITHQ